MSKIVVPVDLLGNELTKDNFVSIHFAMPPIFKVIAVESGGIHTSNGVTPALVRAICDMTLRQMPGVPFSSLIKVVSPSEQDAAERLANLLSKA